MTPLQDWYFQYLPERDAWDLHTPQYVPEVSLKVGVREGKWIAAFHKHSNMPDRVKQQLAVMLPYINFEEILKREVHIITLSSQEILEASSRIKVLEVLTNKEIL